MVSLNTPPSHGVSSGLSQIATYPKMTACHCIMLSSKGEAVIPEHSS